MRTFEALGITTVRSGTQHVEGPAGTGDVDAVARELLAFRDQVRVAAVAGDAGAVLQACDNLRDAVLPSLGLSSRDYDSARATGGAVDVPRGSVGTASTARAASTPGAALDTEEAQRRRAQADAQKRQLALARELAQVCGCWLGTVGTRFVMNHVVLLQIAPEDLFRRQPELYSAFDDQVRLELGVPPAAALSECDMAGLRRECQHTTPKGSHCQSPRARNCQRSRRSMPRSSQSTVARSRRVCAGQTHLSSSNTWHKIKKRSRQLSFAAHVCHTKHLHTFLAFASPSEEWGPRSGA